MTRNRRNKLTEQFIAHPREMRESPAWRYLPDNARRILDRLELEHMQHGGLENGSLPCTYSDFVKAGLRRASVSLAIRQAEALGFLEVTYRGGRAISDARWPSRYRLTYVLGAGKSTERTDEWKRIKSKEEALAALGRAREARNRDTQATRGIKSRTVIKFKKPDAKTELHMEARKRNSDATGAGRETGTPVPDAKPELPSISRPGGTSSLSTRARERSAPTKGARASKRAAREPNRFFPKLFDCFSSEPEITAALSVLQFEAQEIASRLLAEKGTDAARHFISDAATGPKRGSRPQWWCSSAVAQP